MEIDRFKGFLPGYRQLHHHHPRHPEKQDVLTCDQIGGWEVFRQFQRILGPAEGADGPEPGGEPCVQHILVTPQPHGLAVVVVFQGDGLFGCCDLVGQQIAECSAGLVIAHGQLQRFVQCGRAEVHGVFDIPFVGDCAVFVYDMCDARAVPDRDLMPPPKLARDTPGFDVFEPVEIGFFAGFRDDLDVATAHGIECGANDLVGVHKPLIREQRFDHHFGAVPEGLHDGFRFDEGAGLRGFVAVLVRAGEGFHHGQSFGVDVGDHFLARLKPIKAPVVFGHEIHACDQRLVKGLCPIGDGLCHCGLFGVGFAVGAHFGPRVHQVVERDIRTFGDLIVVEVMCACDLDRARAEILVGVFISDDRDQAAVFFGSDRNFAELTNDGRIAFIRWVHRDGPVAQHGFGACGRDRDVVAFFGEGDVPVFVLFDVGIGIAPRQRVFKVPHVAGRFDVFDLKIRNRRLKVRIPVDQSLAAIDQPVVVHLDEYLDDRVVEIAFGHVFGGTGGTGHRERFAGPITGRAQPFELADDGATGFSLPFPDFGGERFAAQLGARWFVLFGKAAFDHHLCGDACVICAGLPERVEPAHPVPAHQNVLQCVVESVPHMQHARNVGGRDHDGIGCRTRARICPGGKAALGFPIGVNACLNFGGVEFFQCHDTWPPLCAGREIAGAPCEGKGGFGCRRVRRACVWGDWVALLGDTASHGIASRHHMWR